MIVKLTNDSLLYPQDGAYISNDTLYASGFKKEMAKKIYLKDIKDIQYDIKYDISSGMLILKNGSRLHCKDMVFLPDSSVECTVEYTLNENFDISKIKGISFRNRWGAAAAGIVIGVTLGTIFYTIIRATHTYNQGTNENADLIGYSGAAAISAAAAVTGWIIGFTYTYKFNP